MSIETQTFYRITCDRCGHVLGDLEHDWWTLDSVDTWLSEGDWLIVEPSIHDPWVRQHYCPDCRDFQPQPPPEAP